MSKKGIKAAAENTPSKFLQYQNGKFTAKDEEAHKEYVHISIPESLSDPKQFGHLAWSFCRFLVKTEKEQSSVSITTQSSLVAEMTVFNTVLVPLFIVTCAWNQHFAKEPFHGRYLSHLSILNQLDQV